MRIALVLLLCVCTAFSDDWTRFLLVPDTDAVFDAGFVLVRNLEKPASNATFFGLISDAERIGRIGIDDSDPRRIEVVDNIAFDAVPEPATWTFVVAGLGLAAFRRRRR